MRIDLAAFNMAYQDQGIGVPLLLIHGYPLNSQMWQPQIDELSNCSRVIAPDLRGHGDSEATDEIYTMDMHARDCNELLEKLSIHQKVVVGGLSMGGYIALAFYRLFPEKVTGLILASTRASADSLEVRSNRDKSMQVAREQGIHPIAEGMLTRLLSPQSLSNYPDLGEKLLALMSHNSLQAILGDLQGMKERPDSLPLLATIQVPVLIIHGQEDQIVPIEEARQMQTMIPRVQFCAIPSAAHLPNLEQPDLFNNYVRTFLKRGL